MSDSSNRRRNQPQTGKDSRRRRMELGRNSTRRRRDTEEGRGENGKTADRRLRAAGGASEMIAFKRDGVWPGAGRGMGPV